MRLIEGTTYSIDEYGNVYNSKGHKMKPSVSNKGYLMFKLFITRGLRKWIYPHIYVAKYWIPNPENKPEVNHLDGNPLNPHKDNLEWVTKKENQEHRIKILKRGIGESSGNVKLKEEDIIWIRENHIPYHKQFGSTPIAKKFNVYPSTISKIVLNQRWKHLTPVQEKHL